MAFSKVWRERSRYQVSHNCFDILVTLQVCISFFQAIAQFRTHDLPPYECSSHFPTWRGLLKS